MIKFKEFLAERYITTDDPDVKEKHLDHVHDMIRGSYKSIGGYRGLGHGTKEESDAIKSDIRNHDTIMKLHKQDGKHKSVMLYKKSHGRKLIAAGTSGDDEGKKSLYKTVAADNKEKRAWGEVSHAMKNVYAKSGMPAVSNNRAEELTGKKIIKKPDGSYDREIGGVVRNKTIMGHPKH